MSTAIQNALDSWTFWFLSRALLGAGPAIVAWMALESFGTLLGTR